MSSSSASCLRRNRPRHSSGRPPMGQPGGLGRASVASRRRVCHAEVNRRFLGPRRVVQQVPPSKPSTAWRNARCTRSGFCWDLLFNAWQGDRWRQTGFARSRRLLIDCNSWNHRTRHWAANASHLNHYWQSVSVHMSSRDVQVNLVDADEPRHEATPLDNDA